MNSTIQTAMFSEMQNQQLFEKALENSLKYLNEAFDRNVYPTQEALDNLSRFDEALPDAPGNTDSILEMLHCCGAPATVSQIGGRYFGFVEGGIIPAALAAKVMADFWDQNVAMEVLSPVSAKLESVVEGWLKQLFSLPQSTVAGFVTGSAAATFCGLAAGRYRLLKNKNWDINEKGLYGAPKIRLVAGRHIHATVLKAIGFLGLGQANIEWVDVDEQGRIWSNQLPELDDTTLVILQAGNVRSGAFDDFETVCDQANRAGAWVHIDGAFGLWARTVDRLKHLTRGMEKANSWSVDGHKTLNTPYDCGIALCSDPEAYLPAMHMSGSYFVQGEQRDGMMYTPDGSRRARIIELWAALKYLGQEGINEMIYGLHERAVQFAEELKNHRFNVRNDVVFNQVLVSCDSDELTTKTLTRIQKLRICWCGGAEWQGRQIIRISVCSWATTPRDVSLSVRSFVQARDEVKR